MAELSWDEVGDHEYEMGIDKGVLYIPDVNGDYSNGVAWNGLKGITESPSGGEANPQYADNIKYLNLYSSEWFGATIEAYTYPDEFSLFDGTVEPDSGLYVHQQERKYFGLCYRTKIGNDVNEELGYKLHLVYGATASPTEKAYETVNDSPEPTIFSWDISTIPVDVSQFGLKPTSLLIIDSTKVDPYQLETLELVLYGDEDDYPMLPDPNYVIGFFASPPIEVTAEAPSFVSETGVITIPTVEGVRYRRVDTDAVVSGLVTISSPGDTIEIIAEAMLGHVLAVLSPDYWSFTRDAEYNTWVETFPGTVAGDNGLFAWFRTRYGTVVEVGRAQNGAQCETISSSQSYTSSYPFYRCTDNRADTVLGNLSISGENDDHWFGWDLGETTKIDITAYSLRCASPSLSPRNWNLEVSNDGEIWESVDVRVNDTTMSAVLNQWYKFTLASPSGPKRFIRFKCTGPCADGREIFAASTIELYGNVTIDQPVVYGIDLRYNPDRAIYGVAGYLARFRDTEAEIYPSSGSSNVNREIGRGMIEESMTPTWLDDDYATGAMFKGLFGDTNEFLSVITNLVGYWQVDLGPRRRLRVGQYTFGQREAFNAPLYEWELQGSDDGENWDTLHTFVDHISSYFNNPSAGGLSDVNYLVMTVPYVNHYYRYFRINPISAANPANMGLGQLEFWGDLIETPAPVIVGATRADQSGRIDTFEGLSLAPPAVTGGPGSILTGAFANLIDANKLTGCVLNQADDNYFMFDFTPNSVRVEELVLVNRTNIAANIPLRFNLEGSNNGTTWDILRSFNLIDDYGWRVKLSEVRSFFIGSEVGYKYLRVHQTGLDSSNTKYLALGEVDFYGDWIPA